MFQNTKKDLFLFHLLITFDNDANKTNMKNKSTNNLTNNCLSIKDFERNSREKERTKRMGIIRTWEITDCSAVSSHS